MTNNKSLKKIEKKITDNPGNEKSKNGKRNREPLPVTGNEEDTVGYRIKTIRRLLKFSQKDFCSRTGISASFMSEVEAGKSKPGFDFLRNAALYLKVSPLYILTGQGPALMGKISDTGNGRETKELLVIDSSYGEEFLDMIEEMLRYFKRSKIVKMAVLEFFSRYLFEHRKMIDEELAKNQATTVINMS